MKKKLDWCKSKKEQLIRYIDGISKLEKTDFNTMLNVYTEILFLVKDIELNYYQELHIYFLKNNNSTNTQFDEIIDLLKKFGEFINLHLKELYNYEKDFNFKYITNKKDTINNNELLDNFSNLHNSYIYYSNIIANKEVHLKLNLILHYLEKSEVDNEIDFNTALS